MYYKNGQVLNSQQAIRNDNKDTSLPVFMTDELIESLGYQVVVDVVPTASAIQRVVEGAVELVDGIPTKIYTLVDKTAEELSIEQLEAQLVAVKHFTAKTEAFIQARIDAYNQANGIALGNAHNCESYSRVTTYPHQVFCLQLWNWNVSVWEAVRTYQASAISIPSDEDFQLVLDSVVF